MFGYVYLYNDGYIDIYNGKLFGRLPEIYKKV